MLVDGAAPPGVEHVCRHGAAWYAQNLGSRVLDLLAATPGGPLTVALAESIEQVAGLHRHTCDVDDERSPQATVAIVRQRGDTVDLLVLADAFILLEPVSGAPEVLTDVREVDVRRECLSMLDGMPAEAPERTERLPKVVAAFRARQNVPDGYFIAKADPTAADQSVVARRDLQDLTSVTLLSNGVSRLVDAYGLAPWPSLLRDLRSVGPDGVLRHLRDVERQLLEREQSGGRVGPDDATIAYCEPS